MSKVIYLSEHKPHLLAEVMCVKRFHRYMCVWPTATPLKDLECETCGKGFIVMTGQPLEDFQ